MRGFSLFISAILFPISVEAISVEAANPVPGQNSAQISAFDSSPYSIALFYLEKGWTRAAISELEKVEPDDPTFLNALMELQKLHYRRQEWAKFFGYAVYYRTYFLNTPPGPQKNFRARLFSLEVLALAKHCLWNEAQDLAHSAIALAKTAEPPEAEDTEIEEIPTYLQLLQTFPELITATANPDLPDPVFRLGSYWPLSQKMFPQIRNPKVLRLTVQSKCRAFYQVTGK